MVTRYELHDDGFDNCDMRASETGEYVLFSDHMSEMDQLQTYNARLRKALLKVIAHTGLPPHPTEDLLLGLLDSIQRISRATLGKE